ncbi:excalibur calcium-binding domain-containing protein [Streptomyces sp. Vc74B-19]|uniref:excalibur calcium-binding domain-containing protein n=1 Tax=unclassified Streptomyces TaxID=2593676 RepID=UPI001BFC7D46|nr:MULTISPECIES: excalibur calcium-binding domain-containing protein [unclassified Streptomyces]MBT3164070.1 excalibur calcium-binding domain-containing protein [Streptomyces sp. Vc74B-19]MCO4697473.1 excalibur calcium-binding domain-containing protein [Streptomyces sp. RO-S4]
MIPFRASAAALLTAVALAAAPATAVAHDGNHPFENCTDAYDNGYSDIPRADEHYGKHLDRDNDGVGCDQPPAGFVPHDDSDDAGAGTEDSGAKEENGAGTDLAETGGSDTTPYLAAGGAAVVLLGGGLMIAARRRRENR